MTEHLAVIIKNCESKQDNILYKILMMCIKDVIAQTFELKPDNSYNDIINVLDQLENQHINSPNIDIYNFDDVMFIGDIHGNAHTFINIMYQLLNEDVTLKFNVCFTGDYCDRGVYSLHIFLAIACLSLLYPQKIIMLRGNHEDVLYWLSIWIHNNSKYVISIPEFLNFYQNNFIDFKHNNFRKQLNNDDIFLQEMIKANIFTHIRTNDKINKTDKCSQHLKHDSTCNEWTCESYCKSMIQNLMFYIDSDKTNDDKTKNSHFCTLLGKFRNAFHSMRVNTIIKITQQNNITFTIYCAHGGLPINIFNKITIESTNTNRIGELIKYLNDEKNLNRKSDINGNNCDDNLGQICWMRLDDDIRNTQDFLLKAQLNTIGTFIQQQNKATPLLPKQITALALKFGIDLIIRGHEYHKNGYEFNGRSLTNHTRSLKVDKEIYKGTICLITKENNEIRIILLQISYNPDIPTTYAKYTNW